MNVGNKERKDRAALATRERRKGNAKHTTRRKGREGKERGRKGGMR